MKRDLIWLLSWIGTLIVFGIINTYKIEPTLRKEGAMEVYRGNTKLQYTIVDSVKVDSCVIFLNK